MVEHPSSARQEASRGDEPVEKHEDNVQEDGLCAKGQIRPDQHALSLLRRAIMSASSSAVMVFTERIGLMLLAPTSPWMGHAILVIGKRGMNSAC